MDTNFKNNKSFALTDEFIINLSEVCRIDISEVEQQRVLVYMNDVPEPLLVTGFAAMELVWQIKPSALEGKRIKWAKHAWSFHNIVAHPVMQLLAYCGFYRRAMWVHDITVPKPLKFKK
jgi:hypothetical protein